MAPAASAVAGSPAPNPTVVLTSMPSATAIRIRTIVPTLQPCVGTVAEAACPGLPPNDDRPYGIGRAAPVRPRAYPLEDSRADRLPRR
ncbi:hypothetical protein GCM10025782_29240 [Pedococcus ginsenosidimutans]|uniref:Uncharacterized protein n=1 Tax=Pedococcus ginsenosidimutans TaxID=490570 RepID=A0ABP8YGP5_9MICO